MTIWLYDYINSSREWLYDYMTIWLYDYMWHILSMEEKDYLINESVNELINGEAVWRTAPATLGLLNIEFGRG